MGSLDLLGRRCERFVGDRHLCRVNAELSVVTELTRFITFSAAAFIVLKVGGDHVEHGDLGQTAGDGDMRSGNGDLVVRCRADTAHVSDEVFGAEVGRGDDRVRQERSSICHPERGLDSSHDGEIEAPSLQASLKGVETANRFEFGDDKGIESLGERVEIVVEPWCGCVVDPSEDRDRPRYVNDGCAKFLASGFFRVGWRGVLEVDHYCIGAGGRHLSHQIGPNGGGEEQ